MIRDAIMVCRCGDVEVSLLGGWVENGYIV